MMVVLCSFIIGIDKILAKILYAKDFYSAWKFVPWLTIAIVFGAMSGYLGGFFSAVKDSKVFAQSSIAGAITNIFLNLLFTPHIGALGAAIATTVCYFEVWMIRCWQSKKYIKLKINWLRDGMTYVLLIAQATVLLLIEQNYIVYLVEMMFFALIILLYTKDIFSMIKKGMKKRA